MRSFFIEIALVTSVARLSGTSLLDQYAVFGAMERYRNLKLGKISEAEGIDDVPEKAKSFCFGTFCAKALEKFTSGWDDSTRTVCEAQIAQIFFIPGINSTNYSPEQKKETLLTIFQALIKRTQIRTHTAKPGYEDINTWLERYYRLQQEYSAFLPVMVNAIVSPGEKELLIAKQFICAEDPLVRLAISREPVSPPVLAESLRQEPLCTFGKMLNMLLTQDIPA